MATLAVDKALRKLLVDSATVSSRVYPLTAPQSATQPYVVYRRISGDHQHHLTGLAGNAEHRFQIDIVGSTYTSVQTAAETIRLALDMQQTTVTIGADSIVINNIRLDGHYDDFEGPIAGKDTGYYRVILDFLIWCEEATS